MLTNNPAIDVPAWLLFSLVLIWALWQGVPEFLHWLAYSADGREDLGFFPDETRGEPGPGLVARSRGAVDPSDARSRHREPTRG
jgi:hypothetical protein